MKMSSWPKIPTPAFEPLQKIRALPPPHPPPKSLLKDLPALPPSASLRPPLDIPYAASTHVVPASYFRISPKGPLPHIPRFETKQERAEAVSKVVDELVRTRLMAWDGKLGGGSETVLFNCLRRFIRNDLLDAKSRSKPGLTLFFAHANGFPKETWEPTLQHLLSSPSVSQLVDEVWVWESIQHGDAGLLNAGKHNGVFDWADNARDILTFLLFHLPTESHGSLPTYLERVSPAETEERKLAGFSKRTLVTIGHSYGGCTSTLAALTSPDLFSSLILVDPVIVQPGRYKKTDDVVAHTLYKGAVQRRDEWPSSQAALEAFQSNPFFSMWDPAVLKTYWECGLYSPNNDSGPVRLKMSGILEGILFLDTLTPCEVFQRLPELDERIELRFVMPGKEEARPIGGPGHGQILVWRRPTNCSNIRIPAAGHLIAQEAPRELALDISAFLSRKYGSTKANL